MAINKVDNPYLQQILAQNLSSSNINPSKLQDSSKLLTSVLSAKAGVATISTNGAKINDIATKIRASGDLQAFSGFQNTMSSINESSDPLRMVRFATSASALGQRDEGQLVESFSNMSKISDDFGKGSLTSFTNAFTSAMEKAGIEGVSSLNSIFKAVSEADYAASDINSQQNIESMFSAVNKALSNKDSSAAKADLSLLSKGVELQPSADSIWNYFNDYIG